MKHDYHDTSTTMAVLRGWMDHHDAVKRIVDGLDNAVGLEPEGPLHETVWKLFDAYTDALSDLIGDADNWLSWYHSENDCGRRGMEAGYNGDLRRIWTLEDLAWLICSDLQSPITKAYRDAKDAANGHTVICPYKDDIKSAKAWLEAFTRYSMALEECKGSA